LGRVPTKKKATQSALCEPFFNWDTALLGNVSLTSRLLPRSHRIGKEMRKIEIGTQTHEHDPSAYRHKFLSRTVYNNKTTSTTTQQIENNERRQE